MFRYAHTNVVANDAPRLIAFTNPCCGAKASGKRATCAESGSIT